MTSPQTPDAKASAPKLDAPTVQAVIELRRALRAVKSLGRIDTVNMTPTQRGIHPRNVERAQFVLREARIALEQILEDE